MQPNQTSTTKKKKNHIKTKKKTLFSSLFPLFFFFFLTFLLITDVLIPPVPLPPPTHPDTLASLPFKNIWHLSLSFQLFFSFAFTFLTLFVTIPFFHSSLFSSSLPSSQFWGWYGGFVIGVFGWLTRTWAKITLGNMFTYQISIPKTTLITTQPYKYIIHPGYFGAIIHILGLSIMISSGIRRGKWRGIGGVVIVMAMAIGSICVRILEEEKMLEGAFGEVWAEHAASRWHMIPFVW